MCKVKSEVPWALNLRLGVSSVVSPDMSQCRAAEEPGDLAGRRLQVMAKRGKGGLLEGRAPQTASGTVTSVSILGVAGCLVSPVTVLLFVLLVICLHNGWPEVFHLINLHKLRCVEKIMLI
uniref:Uncharacterized protein n=1 Tax=Pipistrellus kuhlii TaxID=59472 RepID=A0A7J7VN54_PIPKU|nr:hypothetical protein mPipKuh1_008386 [Pipistrellus kuhlii]